MWETVILSQQSRVVKIHTDLKVGEYYGAKNVDNWGTAEWETQISDVEVRSSTTTVSILFLLKLWWEIFTWFSGQAWF